MKPLFVEKSPGVHFRPLARFGLRFFGAFTLLRIAYASLRRVLGPLSVYTAQCPLSGPTQR
jgi:hypothetical protein